MTEELKSYKQLEMAKKLKITRLSMWQWKHKDKYIPIKFEDALSRRTKQGYSIRYIKVSDVLKYLKENKALKTIK